MGEKTIYLIRHAHPAFPDGIQKMCLGRRHDLPLSSLGLQQAAALAERFASVPLEAVYTSPLKRARQTAQAVAGSSRSIHVLDDLIELDGGEWDGLTFDQLHERYPESFGPNAKGGCPPGGESDEAGLARMKAALNAVAENTQSCAAIVAHSGVNRLLLCELAGLPLSEKKQMGQDYAAVSVLVFKSGAWTVAEHAFRQSSRTYK